MAVSIDRWSLQYKGVSVLPGQPMGQTTVVTIDRRSSMQASLWYVYVHMYCMG